MRRRIYEMIEKGVEGGLLPADVRRVRDALIEFPIG